MDASVIVAIVTALGALAVAVVGYVVNRRLGVPNAVQQTIREERKLYEKSLEDKASRLEAELDTEREARQADKAECLLQINRLADMVVDRDLIIERLQARVGKLDGEEPS